ncbi:MAG: TolC family protein [Desulfuromonadales bacterium]|nr:TolC family protein [Desulfuromonadales bacterium]
MKIRYIIALLLLFLANSVTSYAAETRILTLDQALAIAADKNRDIEKAREYGKSMQGKYIEERAAAFPQFSIYGTAMTSRDQSLPEMMGGGYTQYAANGGVSVTQPLFAWGKIAAGIRLGKEGLKTVPQQLRMAQQGAKRDVSSAFYDILLAHELLKLAQENSDQKKRFSSEAHKKFDSGVATDYDVLAADVAVENAKPEIIRSENRLKIAKDRLAFLLTIDNQEVDANGKLSATIKHIPTYDEAVKTAFKNRPELLDQQSRIKMNQELISIASTDNKPHLDLKGDGSWRLFDFGPIQNNGPAWSVGLYLTFPIFDGFRTQGRVQQAESDYTSSIIDEQKLKDSIRLDVRTAMSNVQESQRILLGLEGTVKQAEKLLDMAEKGYKYGVKIKLEVDDAQLNLLQARSNLAQATRDYLMSLVTLDWTMGILGE